MSKIAKIAANKIQNIPDYKVIGKVIPDITKKINKVVTDKKANNVINIIDYINNRIQTKITNVSVDTWSETFETDWKRNSDYSNPICAVFLVSKGSATINIDNREYELNQGELCIVNEWCNHKLINKTTSPLTMLLAQFKWDKEVHE